MAEHRLERTAFTTSRLLEFSSEKELVSQTGHSAEEWPFVILKELADNGLDATEEHGVAPVISISVDTERRQIVITDNGPGIPPETVASILDYSKRTSSREAYVSPTRGAQGNALSTIIAMPFALYSTAPGVTVIEARGIEHRITFAADPIRREPRLTHETAPSIVKNGTRITLTWPLCACSILERAEERFLQIAESFAWLNPHLTVTAAWNGEVRLNEFSVFRPNWKKWRACDPTSAHWYDVARLERYAAALVEHDQDHGRERLVREFVGEFRGLSGSAKQRLILDETGLARLPLSALFEDGPNRVRTAQLLAAMRRHSRPVKATDLGVIGKDCLFDCFTLNGVQQETFRYEKRLGEVEGVPYVVEVAFGWCDVIEERFLIAGVNWSVAIHNPFRHLTGGSLDSLLAEQHAGKDEPIALLVHLACPRIGYTDRGKSAIAIHRDHAEAIKSAILSVTKEWAKQRKAEERDQRRKENRAEQLVKKPKRMTIKEAAWQVMPDAYAKASAGLGQANARQVMYAARPAILELTGKRSLNDHYFTQTLLPDYIAANPERCKDWQVDYDDRGSFVEPHTGRSIGLGTKSVNGYLLTAACLPIDMSPRAQKAARTSTKDNLTNRDDLAPTFGPEARYRAVLFVEKEGFAGLLKAAQIAERYDVAIMSTKGMSVIAARILLDRISQHVDQVFVLHDFDLSGFSILGTLGTDSRRYQFNRVIPVIDVGLRLSQVRAMSLESEPVLTKGWAKRRATLAKHGATAGEIEFLRNRRVELNAMTSRQFIDLIENAFAEHGVQKLIPDAAVIERQARRLVEARLTREALDKIRDEVRRKAMAAVLPDDLEQQVKAQIELNPVLPWDLALAAVLKAAG